MEESSVNSRACKRDKEKKKKKKKEKKGGFPSVVPPGRLASPPSEWIRVAPFGDSVRTVTYRFHSSVDEFVSFSLRRQSVFTRAAFAPPEVLLYLKWAVMKSANPMRNNPNRPQKHRKWAHRGFRHSMGDQKYNDGQK